MFIINPCTAVVMKLITNASPVGFIRFTIVYYSVGKER